jgi:hypothetical protein
MSFQLSSSFWVAEPLSSTTVATTQAGLLDPNYYPVVYHRYLLSISYISQQVKHFCISIFDIDQMLNTTY